MSNASLAASTGDAGFNDGSIAAVCDSSQKTQFKLAITRTGSDMSGFAGSAFYGCSFTMTFADAQASSLAGTIEINAVLGGGSATDANNTITIAIKGKVYVTGGTGIFGGAVGSGTFEKSQTIDIPTADGGGGGSTPTSTVPAAACTALGLAAGCTSVQVEEACKNPAYAAICTSLPRKAALTRVSTRAGGSAMKLALRKGNGAARILAPAAPAGKPRAAATVKAKTKVKLAATAGSRCTVKTSTGATVGTKTVGTKGTATIAPKAGSYTAAKWIKATCTKGGTSFSSNQVRISLK